MKISENFNLEDFFDWQTFKNEPDKNKLIQLIDIRIFKACQLLRDNLKVPLLINTWLYGGARNWSGYRTTKSPQYKKGSMHSVGKAVDIVSPHMTAEQMRKHIRENYHIYKDYIKRIEKGVNWLHIDCKDTNSETLIEFSK